MMTSFASSAQGALFGLTSARKRREAIRPLKLIGITAVVALITGCASASPSPSAAQSPTGSANAAATPSAHRPSATPAATAVAIASQRPSCPNGNGGTCLGSLVAGTYTTETFDPPTTYTVPDGWGNYEDLLGNFLLVPPAASFDGVDNGTSDYLGIYSSVTMPAPCSEPAPGLHEPGAIARYITEHPEFTTSNLRSVKVGGLSGVVLDIKLAKTWKKACADPDGGPAANLISGLPPSDFDHSIGGKLTIRLYLLAHGSDVLAIEIDDVASGGAHFSTFDPVVKSLRFSAT
jgi:hypothetical protein